MCSEDDRKHHHQRHKGVIQLVHQPLGDRVHRRSVASPECEHAAVIVNVLLLLLQPPPGRPATPPKPEPALGPAIP